MWHQAESTQLNSTYKNFQAHVDLHVQSQASVVHGQPSVLHVHNLDATKVVDAQPVDSQVERRAARKR